MPPVDQIKKPQFLYIYIVPKYSKIHPTVQSRRPFSLMLCIHFRSKLSECPHQLHHTPSRGIPINISFLLCIHVQLSTWTSEANFSETFHQPHTNSLTLSPGLNVYMYATCNATHTALCLGLYWSAFLKLHADYPNGGRNVWSWIGSHQCCMHSNPPGTSCPDLIPRGC